MGTFSDFVTSNGLDEAGLVRTSARIEAHSSKDQTLLVKRATKRRTEKEKSYADASIEKPASGRAFSSSHFKNALKDTPVPTRIRSKILKAVNASLAKKGKEAVDMKTLFGEVAAAKGEAPKAKAKR